MVKTFFRVILIIFTLLGGSLEVQSQDAKFWTPQNSPLALKSWNQLNGVPLKLLIYGLYENDNFINTFFPNDEGFTEGGILTTSFGGLKFWKLVTGDRSMDIKFDARVDGLMLYTNSPQEDILWHKILKVGKMGTDYILLTVDNRNTGRFWLIDIDSYMKKNKLPR